MNNSSTASRSNTSRNRRRKRKTRNTMLILASCLVIFYTIVDIVLAFYSLRTGSSYQLDSTLTTQIFDYAKWLCGGSAVITVAKTLKGRTNHDEDEPFIPTD